MEEQEEQDGGRQTLYQAELFPLIAHAMKAKAVKNQANQNFSSHANSVSENRENSKTKKSQKKVNLPAIPPKKVTITPNLEEKKEEHWYFVRSPREEYGAQGPHNVEELKQFKRVGILKDSTLMWQEGLKLWMPLATMTQLKNSLVKLPVIPDRDKEQAAFDPIAAPPTREQILSCEKLDDKAKYMSSRFCSKCGATAVGHLPQSSLQDQDLPDFTLLRRSLGSYQNASEIIPGLLWIGNASTGRSKFFSDLGVDLIINCTANLKTPDSKPPYYRCATIPLPEEKLPVDETSRSSSNLSRANTTSLFSRSNSALTRTNSMESVLSADTEELSSSPLSLSRMNSTAALPTRMEQAEVLDWFEKCYDFIENVRLFPDRAREGDPAPHDWTGPVDRYGRPIRTKEEIAIATATRKLLDESEGRDKKVLLWSRLGFDRPCVLAAAYLVRRWGLTAESAVDFVRKGRKGLKISEYYLAALRDYAALHAFGELLCADCLCHHTVPLATVTVTVPVPGTGNQSSAEGEAVTETVVRTVAHRLALPKNSVEEAIAQRFQERISLSLSAIGSGSAVDSLRIKLGSHPLTHLSCHRSFPPSHALTAAAGAEFSSLLDLRLRGQQLSDEEATALVHLLSEAQLLRQLHLIDLSDNSVSCGAVSALCQAMDQLQGLPELSVLLLRNNKIGPHGAKSITRLLEPRYSLHTLSLANNLIGDTGGLSLVSALIFPEKDLFDSEEYKADPDAAANASLYGKSAVSAVSAVSAQGTAQGQSKGQGQGYEEEPLIKNATVTSLDLSNNSLGKETLEALAIVMKSNLTLRILQLDCCGLSSVRGAATLLNRLFDECRASNRALCCLSLSDTPLSVASCGHLLRIFDSNSSSSGAGSPLQELDLSRCGLTALHLRKSLGQSRVNLSSSRHLSRLVLSGNKLTDQGITALLSALQHPAQHQRGGGGPTLRSLDVSCCELTIASAIPLLQTVCGMESMRSLDLSDNDLHGTIAQMKTLFAPLALSSPSGSGPSCGSSLQSLNLCRCALGVHGSCSLFSALSSPSSCSLRVLLLAENEVKDSVDGPLSEFLHHNCSLEFLDLGYNCLTSGALRLSQAALAVQSSSSLERKLTELHINLIGNPCGPYELELPGMARSKTLLRFGQEQLDGEEFRSHISGAGAAEDYWQRRKLLGQLRPEPWTTINLIS